MAGYPGQFGNVLITKETLDKFIKTMVGVPVIINHKDITEKNADDERVGVVNSVWYDNKDGWYWCDGIIWNETAQNLITDKNWSVSCSYNVKTADNEGGSENNIKYDMEFLDGVFTHLALVNNPRYERANIVLNSKTEFINVNNEDKWITVHPNGEENKGRHLLLKEGETPYEAVKRTYGLDGAKGQQKLFDTSGDRKTKEDFRREKEEKQKQYAKLEERKKEAEKLDKEEAEKAKKEDALSMKEEEFVNKYFNKVPANSIWQLYDYWEAAQKEKQQDKKEDKQEDKQEAKKQPETIDQYITDKSDKGWMYQTKGVTTYSNSGKRAEVEEFGENGGKYRAVFYDGTKRKDIKVYSTKRGMEKAVRDHLGGGANKETKALETKTDLEAAKTRYNDVLSKYNAADRKRWESGISPEEYHKAWVDYEKYKKELTGARREYAESIMSNFEAVEDNPYEERQQARRDRYEELSQKAATESSQAHQQFRDKMSFIPAGQPIHGQRDARYRERAWDTLGRAVKLGEKSDYYADKASSVGKAGISSDDANAIAKLAQKYKSGVDSAEKRRIIDRVIDIHKRSTSTAPESESTDLGFSIERNKDINRLQLKFNDIPDANTRSILKSNGFRWSPREKAWQRQLNGNSETSLKYVMEKLKADNALVEGITDILENHNVSKEDLPILEGIRNILG